MFLRPLVAAVATLLWAAALAAPVAESATAASLRIQAAPGGRLHVQLGDRIAIGRNDFVLDGRRVRRTGARAISFRVPGEAIGGKARLRWRRLEVRRAGSSDTLARARLALATRSSSGAPTLVLLEAPLTRTRSRSATFRFSASGGKTTCRRDNAASRPCARAVRYRSLAVRQHRFTVRATGTHGGAVLRVAWRILPPPRSTLAFEDNFDGTTLDTDSWGRYYSVGHAGNGLRRPSAFALDGNGNLVVTAQMVNGQIVSGGMAHRENFRYGRFEFRVRTEPDPTGTMSGVVLTWPQSGNWPADGENDIYETGHAAATRSPFYTFIHYDRTNQQRYFIHRADASQWHTMAMDWSPDAIRIYRDGELVWTLTDAAVIPDVAHHLTIQLDAMASRTLTTPVRMYVDYVRIYRYG